MITIEPTKESIDEAKKLAKEMGKLNNSITDGKGNIAGFLGEVLARKLLNATQSNTYNYDIILSDGKTVDVKTKRTNHKPKDYYDCSVAALNTKQKCDYYAFMRVMNDYSKAWFIGLIPKETYLNSSSFMKKGDIDKDNNFTVRSDCYNMSINKVGTHSEHEEYV
jgi:hypothetical protein